MGAGRIYWGQIITVLLAVTASAVAATQWTADALGYQPQLGPPDAVLWDAPVYAPWKFLLWRDVFGAAALGTLINVGVAATEDPQITFSGIGGVSRDPVDQAIQDGVQRSASTVTNRVVDRGLAIPPTIRVQAGARISVIVTRRSTF